GSARNASRRPWQTSAKAIKLNGLARSGPEGVSLVRAQELARSATMAGSMPHALIVDDSAATLSALVELVSAEGFTTSAALTVDRAKVELSRQSPDIVLADLNLPDGTGMHLLHPVQRSGAAAGPGFSTPAGARGTSAPA